MATPEPLVNEHLAMALRRRHPQWLGDGVIVAESTAAFTAKGQRPDIIVCDDWAAPVGIETEYIPAASVEKDAAARLGKVYNPTGGVIHSVIAVRYPTNYRDLQGQAISNALETEGSLEYCLLSGSSSDDFHRWPATGYVKASVDDLAVVVTSARVSPILIAQAAQLLEEGAKRVATQIGAFASTHVGTRNKISSILKQDAGAQTYAMAATILINALVFQETLSGASEALSAVPSISAIGQGTSPTRAELVGAWDTILSINYWPIFGVARAIVNECPADLWNQIREACMATADQLLSINLGKNPDLVGTMFQRLISDRKFLATFYTAPSSAALMAGLLVEETPPGGGVWNDVEKLSALKIADFACGTGSLLCAVYADVRRRIEHSGLDSAETHRSMVERSIFGTDVLPSATYITASQVSSAHPTVQYGGTKILTLPFGENAQGEVSLGALDLLEKQSAMSTIATASSEITANAVVDTDAWSAVGGATVNDESFDIVAMNPPFTRLTGGGGKSSEVSRPLFAAFGTSENAQKRMARKAQRLLDNTAYHGNAGAGSAFVEIGHRKLKPDGRIGLILPLSSLSGASWSGCRALWRDRYADVLTLSIAADDGNAAFSADTGMAEAMIVARKSAEHSARLTSVCLTRRPVSPLEGMEIAREIKQLIEGGTVRTIEDGPFGGTDIMIGSEKVGEMITAPTAPDPWPLSRIRDHAVAQCAFSLTQGSVWLPGSLAPLQTGLALCRLSQLGEPGAYHLDVSGSGYSGGAPRGPFELQNTVNPAAATFPVLKAHDESRERYLEIAPDAEGVMRTSAEASVREIIQARAQAIWGGRTRLHFATDVQFNSNALVAVMTSRAAIGGRAWPSFKLYDDSNEAVLTLWFNSTLGILNFWWNANKTQDGRGSVTTSRLSELTSIDPGALSKDQLQEAATFFAVCKSEPLLDIHECADDPVRAKIDRFIAEHILCAGGQLQEVEDGLQLLRAKLALEPSIRGARRLRQ